MVEARSMEAVPAEEAELLKVIIEEIHRAAEEEARRIIEEAQKEAERIIEEAKRKAEELREEKIRKLIYERRAAVEREIAPKRLEIKRNYIKEKYSLLFKIFDEVLSEAEKKLKKSGDYDTFLESALERALSEVRAEEVIIHPAPREKRKVSSVLKKVLPRIGRKVKAKVGDAVKSGGGVFVEAANGKEYFNASLEAKKLEIRQRVLPETATRLLKGF